MRIRVRRPRLPGPAGRLLEMSRSPAGLLEWAVGLAAAAARAGRPRPGPPRRRRRAPARAPAQAAAQAQPGRAAQNAGLAGGVRQSFTGKFRLGASWKRRAAVAEQRWQTYIQTDGRTDGRTGGLTDGRTDRPGPGAVKEVRSSGCFSGHCPS
jgi:hypothetical protein